MRAHDRWRIERVRVIIGFLSTSVVLALVLSPCAARVRPGGLWAWASTAPMIDGFLRPTYAFFDMPYPAEWADAYKVNFVLAWGAEVHDASVYVMNDYVNLYIAFEIKFEDYDPDDQVWVNFDNDDDNEKEVGDNVLCLDAESAHVETFAGKFHDRFWLRPGDEYPNTDSAVDGIDDGVGACKFTGETLYNGNYTFEFAFPLDTSDDDHDFSLDVGDTVGFNILYLDAYGGPDSEAGWPTFTKVNWAEMAAIRIAGPALPPPPSTVNLKIGDIEITQAVQFPNNTLPLVLGKTTIVRVYVVVLLAGYIRCVPNVEVYLYATRGFRSRALPGVFSSNGPLRQSFDAPVTIHREHLEDSANFLLPDYWTQETSMNLQAFVKAPLSQGESDYADNWMMYYGSPKRTVLFKSTTDLTVHVYPFDVTWATPSQPTDKNILDIEQYLLAAYPVADINFIRHAPFRWSGHSIDDAIEELNVQALALRLRHPTDLIFGFLPSSTGFNAKSNPDWDIEGYDGLGFAAAGPMKVTCREGVMAHEFIHNLGPGCGDLDIEIWGWGLHTFHDADWPYPNNNINEYGMSAAWGWPPLLIPLNTPDIMSYDQSGSFPTTWMSPYRWENLYSYLDPPAAASTSSIQQTGEGLVISGWISKNGTGSLRSIFRFPETQESPSGPSNYSLVLKDSTGSTLLNHSFGISFVDPDGEEQDPDYFTVVLPYLNATRSVSLLNGTILLDQITASANAPQVQVISPNGGETAGNDFTIAWTASDLDSDPLTFMVFYSGDNGSSWTPASPRITETAYLVNASRLPGGSQSLIRVMASDGFHTSSDQSDGVFSVPRKAPLDVTCTGAGPCNQYNFGDLVSVKGSAFDPEDGVLQDSAFTWTSSTNGVLGTGRVLTTTDLLPGNHTITLTATDSDGNNSTHSFTVNVELHDIAVVDFTTTKTVVGEGYGLVINYTLWNQGLSGETFNVTLVANKINVSFPSIQLFGSATEGWGFNTSNMTSPGPTITVNQWDRVNMLLFSADSLKHNFFIDYNGDESPSSGEPKSPDFTTNINYQFVADTRGAFAYYCQYHSSVMFGTFIVQEPTIESYYQETIEPQTYLGSTLKRTSIKYHTLLGLIKGYYNIGIHAGPVTGEIDTADNTFTDGWIIVATVGDVNADGIVDIEDIYGIALAYGSLYNSTDGQYWHPPPCGICPHSPNLDINADGIIDIEDIYTTALHYGETG